MKRTAIIAIAFIGAVALAFNLGMHAQNMNTCEHYTTPPVLLSGNTPGGLPVEPLTFWQKVAGVSHPVKDQETTCSDKPKTSAHLKQNPCLK